MKKAEGLSIDGINKIDLTFGGAITLFSLNGNTDVEEYNLEQEIVKLLQMPEDEIPDRFFIEVEVAGDDRHFMLEKCCDYPVIYGMEVEGAKEVYTDNWFTMDGVRDDASPGGWDILEKDGNPRFDQAYFNFLMWIYRDKLSDLQREKDFSDEVFTNMYFHSTKELNLIWQSFKVQKTG